MNNKGTTSLKFMVTVECCHKSSFSPSIIFVPYSLETKFVKYLVSYKTRLNMDTKTVNITQHNPEHVTI